MREHFEIDIRWTAFPLNSDIPDEGLPLAELYARKGIDIVEAVARQRRVADELGLPFGKRNFSYNSRKAAELSKWAEEKGQGDAFVNAVFRAYFADDRNIGRIDVLTDIAKTLGLPASEAEDVLKAGTYKKAVDDDWALSRRLGITAVPTFVLDGRAVVGAQPYETLEKFLLAGGVRKR